MQEASNIEELEKWRGKADEDDAANYRNLLKARTMKALGVEDEVYTAIIDGFEKRVEMEARSMVGGV